MTVNFQQYYVVGDQKFHNIYQAFDFSKKTKEYVHYRIDEDYLKQLCSFKLKKTPNPYILQELITKKLRYLRKKYNCLKLAFSGGTDSFTILKCAMDNGIYLDEVILRLVSFTGDKQLNQELLPGITYAKKYENKLIGKFSISVPHLDDLHYYDIKNFWKNPKYLTGDNIFLRPIHRLNWLTKYTHNLDGIVIQGTDKPSLYKFKNKIFYFIIDKRVAEYMGVPNLFHFFIDKEHPELSLNLIIANRNYALNKKQHWKKVDQHYEFTSLVDKELACQYLDSIGYYYLDKNLANPLMGKNPWDSLSLKNIGVKNELIKLGRQDIILKFEEVHKQIKQEYSGLGFIEEKGNLTKTIGRYSQFLQLTEDSVSL